MRSYFKITLYIIITTLISTLIVTTLHYFNIISDNISNLLKTILLLISFLYFTIKYSNKNKKEILKLTLPFCFILFIISLFIVGFSLKNLIYYLLIALMPLVPSYIKKKVDD